MKILIISTMAGNPWGGSEVLWMRVAQKLLKDGHQVYASVFDWKKEVEQLENFNQNGGVIIKRSRINYADIKGKIKGKIKSKTLSLYQLNQLHKINPDIILFSQGAAFDLSIPVYRKFLEKNKKPYYCYISLNTEYEVLPIETIKFQRKIFEKAEKIFFVSQRNLDTAKRQICSHLENAIVINNPPTFEDFTEIGYPNNEVLKFAMVARINAYVKGHAIVLEALSKDFWKDKKWELEIYGKGDDLEYVNELISFYQLKDKVKIMGYVNDIKNDIWAKNHVLLMPSQYEGCPISLYDAALCGRTAVVSDVGGNAEFIEDGINGFVAEAPSVNSFFKAMKRAWDKKNDFKKMGELAREKAIKTLDLNPENLIIETFYLSKN